VEQLEYISIFGGNGIKTVVVIGETQNSFYDANSSTFN
jgi:hypothetical protein